MYYYWICVGVPTRSASTHDRSTAHCACHCRQTWSLMIEILHVCGPVACSACILRKVRAHKSDGSQGKSSVRNDLATDPSAPMTTSMHVGRASTATLRRLVARGAGCSQQPPPAQVRSCWQLLPVVARCRGSRAQAGCCCAACQRLCWSAAEQDGRGRGEGRAEGRAEGRSEGGKSRREQ